MTEVLRCHNCGWQISLQDESCPHCGYPVRPWREKITFSQRFLSAIRITSIVDSYTKGIDLAKWQTYWHAEKTKEQGGKFAMIKAIQNGEVDPKFDDFAREAEDQDDFEFGVYIFCDPAGKPAVEQARLAADVVKGIGRLWVAGDAEWTGGLGMVALNNWYFNFFGELGVLLPDRKLACYTRQTFWDSKISPADWAKKIDLWAARWAYWLESPWSDGKYKFRDWLIWWLWQYSSDGNGLGYLWGVGSNSIDLNYFPGSFEDLKKHHNIEQELTLEERMTLAEADIDNLQDRVNDLEQNF